MRMTTKQKERFTKIKDNLVNLLEILVPDNYIYEITEDGFTGKDAFISDQIRKLKEKIQNDENKIIFKEFSKF